MYWSDFQIIHKCNNTIYRINTFKLNSAIAAFTGFEM